MKNMLKIKKGFTLVELLAVIVILALLIVITANTILPMLGRTEETGMVTYAKRVLNNALTSIEADKLATNVSSGTFYYGINTELTKNESYFGCVKAVLAADGSITYGIKMFSNDDDLYLNYEGVTDIVKLTGNTVTDPVVAYSLDKDSSYVEGTDGSNCDASHYTAMKAADPNGDGTNG